MGEIHFSLRDIHLVGPGTRELLVHPDDCPSLRRHHIWLAGVSKAAKGFRFVRHQSRMGQILVCFRGQGRVWVDGRWQKCGQGMAYLTPPRVFNSYESGPRWEIGWITFGPDAPLHFPVTPRLIETDPRPFEYVLLGLHQETSTNREPAMLERWAQLLHRHATRVIVPDHSARLWRLWQAVQANFAEPWDLPRLARQAGLGPENLRRICLRETGTSPMQHVTRLRMQYAASLLTSGRKIEEVAHLAGYSNAFAFSTTFKRVMKRSPSQFRA